MESKVCVWLKYGKTIVLYGNFFLAPTVYVRERAHIVTRFKHCVILYFNLSSYPCIASSSMARMTRQKSA